MSETNMEQFRSAIVERIIRSRGQEPTYGRQPVTNDAEPYQAFLVTEGYPQMGFSLFCADGNRHGFFYHNLDNLQLVERETGTFLRFTHRGKAITMRGRGLQDLFDAVIEHTLQAIYEYNERVWPQPQQTAPIIDRVQVTDLSPQPPNQNKSA